MDFKDDEDYWKNHLFDANQYVKFYNIQSTNYNQINLSLNNKTLSDFLKEKHISKFNFIASIFSLYLSRIDRTMGCLLKTGVCDGGFYKNALLKIGYDGETLFDDYLNEIKNQSEIAAEHVKVDIDNYLAEDKSFYSINDFSNLRDVSIFNGQGNALTLNVYEDHLDLIYNEGLFSDVYMEHMVENIDSTISNVLDDSKQQCKDIDILSDAEKQLLFKFYKGKSVDVDLDETLSMAFRKNSIKYSDIIAVDDGIDQITYAELERSSNSVAYDLSNNYDLDLGDCVGLMLPRDYHFPELVLALNKMGVAFIPIDTDYPLKRIEHMLNIGEAKSIITTRNLADINDFDVEVICIDDLKYDLDVEFDIIGSSEDVFSIMFTSGTTGLPKGVMISNKVLTGVGVGMKEICNSSPGDVTGCYNSFSFGASFRIYIALHYGETCRIYNDKERNDSLMFIEALKNQPLNDLLLPPGLGLSILENEPDIDLGYMMFTGAKLESMPESDNGIQLVNFFGTTETSYAIAGAAWATVLSSILSCVIMGYWIWIKKDLYLDLNLKNFNFQMDLIKDNLQVAIPSTFESLIFSALAIIINFMLLNSAGHIAVGVYSVAMRVVQFATLPLIAIGTAVVTVAGVAYGADNPENLNLTLSYSIKISFLISVVLVAIMFIFSPQIALLFSYTEASSNLAPQIAGALSILCFFTLTVPLGIMSTMMFQGVGKGVHSFIITLFRSLVFDSLFAYLFGFVFGWGLNGIYAGVVFGSFVGGILGYVLAKNFIRKFTTSVLENNSMNNG